MVGAAPGRGRIGRQLLGVVGYPTDPSIALTRHLVEPNLWIWWTKQQLSMETRDLVHLYTSHVVTYSAIFLKHGFDAETQSRIDVITFG